MSDTDVLGAIRQFVHQNGSTALELTFSSLEIHSFLNGKLLHVLTKPQGKVRIHPKKQQGLARMDVLDNLVFQFSFNFAVPHAAPVYQSSMLHLPRPLMDGTLKLDSEQLLLEFVIDTPNKDHNIQIQHRYTRIMEIKQLQVSDTTCGLI